jgi:hypothetical protein
MNFDLAFVLVDLGVPWYKTATAEMIRSARRAYKAHDMRVVQLTDNKSPVCPDVDGAFNLDTEITADRMAQAKGYLVAEYALQADRPVIFCDVDIIWNTDFLTDGLQELEHVGCLWRQCMPSMPFNTGIIATYPRDPFWTTYQAACNNLPKEMQFWWGDQVAMMAADCISGGLVTRMDMNAIAPAIEALPTEPLTTPAVHFKGERKHLMTPYARLLDKGEAFEFVRPELEAINISVTEMLTPAPIDFNPQGWNF